MNKYDFSGNLQGLDGKDIYESGVAINIANLFSSFLAGKTPGVDAGKAMGFAVQLHNSKILQCDDTDKKKLQEAINGSDFGNIVKYSILKVFDNPIVEDAETPVS